MSEIFLLYNGQKKEIKTPDSMSDLQSEFLKQFYEDKNKEFIYFYTDKGEDIDIERCSNFSEIIESIKKMEEPIIKIKKKEASFNLKVGEERIEKDENNSDELDPVRSGQVFSKPKKEEEKIKSEPNTSETIHNKPDFPNVNILEESTEMTKSIVMNNSNTNQKNQNNYETPQPDSCSSSDEDENQTPTGDEKPKYNPNKNIQKVEKKEVKNEEKSKKIKQTNDNKEQCNSLPQEQRSQMFTNETPVSDATNYKIMQNPYSQATSAQNKSKDCDKNDSIEELRKKLKELESFKTKSVENNRSMANKNLELSKNLKKEKEENQKLKKLLNAKKPCTGNDEDLEKIKKDYESKIEESNKRIEEIENEKKNIESKNKELNQQFLEEKEKNKKLIEECEKIKSQMNALNENIKTEDEKQNHSLNNTKKEDEEKNELRNRIKQYEENLRQAQNTISKLQNDIKKISDTKPQIANIQLSPSPNLKLSSQEEEINIARENKKKSEKNRNDKILHLSKIYKKKAQSSKINKEQIGKIEDKEKEKKDEIIQKSKLKHFKIPAFSGNNKINDELMKKLSIFEKENLELKKKIEEQQIQITKNVYVISNLNKKIDFGNQMELIKELCQKIIKEKSEALIKKELSPIESNMNRKIEETTKSLKNNYKLKYDKLKNELKKKFQEIRTKIIDITGLKDAPPCNDLFLIDSNKDINIEPKDTIKKFSYECINVINLSAYIYQGTDEAKVSIILKNNCNQVWPKEDTKLVLDKDSKISIDDIVLHPQKPDEQNSYEICIKNLGSYPPGEYISYMLFQVNGKSFGDKLQIKIIVKAKKKDEDIQKYIEKINEFRSQFELEKSDYSDEKILNLLKSHNFDYEQSFSSLFE